MKLLLDTHIWLWSLEDDRRLSQTIRREIDSQENECWVSAISVWEALVLHRKRRIDLGDNLEIWLRDAMALMHEAPLTQEIAMASHQLDWKHNDPADRWIAGTAQVIGLTLVTADESLLRLKSIQTLPNR